MAPVPTALPDLDAPYALSSDALRDFERDLVGNLGLETLDLHFDGVTADRQRGDLIVALAIGLRGSFE